MSPWAGLAAALLMIFASGEGLLLLLRIGPAVTGRAGRAATGFLLGTATIATWSLLVHIVFREKPPFLVALPVLLYAAGRFVSLGRVAGTPGDADSPAPSGGAGAPVLARLAIAAAAVQAIYIFHHALMRPIHSWDAWKIWSFRAKVVYMENGFPADFFSSGWAGFPGYPLGIPLVEAFVARIIGGWHEPSIKFLFPLFYLALLVLFTMLVRIEGGRRAAAAGLLVLAPAPLLVHHGAVAYMDLPLACFLLASVAFLAVWEKKGNSGALLLAAMHAGFLVQIKNEGLPFYLLLTAVAALRARRKGSALRDGARWLAASLPFAFPWLLFKYGSGIPDSPYHDLDFPGAVAALGRLLDFLRLSARSAFLSGSWGIAWYALVLLPFLGRKVRFGIPAVVAAGGYFLFAAAYSFTDSYEFLTNGTALGRNLLVLFPPAVAWAAISLFGGRSRSASAQRAKRSPSAAR